MGTLAVQPLEASVEALHLKILSLAKFNDKLPSYPLCMIKHKNSIHGQLASTCNCQ